jgi:hypothetical protein
LISVIALSGVVVFGQNYKIKQTTSMGGGQNMTSTVYVKGSRKRTESGGMIGMTGDVATLEQCDLKRTVQVNDKKKLYYVMETHASPAAAPATGRTTAPKPTKGGTITQTTNITDTGERKQMFGLTARHIKTTMSMTSSADACNKTDMSMQTDGWYVDLPAFSCPAEFGRTPYVPPARTGCQDTYVTRSTGAGKLGFPLEMTQTMQSGGGTSFTQTISTVEFSKAALEDALFNVPADYKLASSSQDLYGMPDYASMMGNERANTDGTVNPSLARQNASSQNKKAGVKRIGVLMPSVRSSEPVSAEALRAYLVSQLTQGKTDAVAVSSEAEARAAGCDYLLTTDVSKLKQSTAGKIGGLFGGVTGAPTAGKFEAQVEYTLVSLADGKNALKNKSSDKSETDATMAAEAVLALEARAVLAAAK